MERTYSLSSDEILSAVKRSDIEIPLAIFHNDYLSALESIVKYLKENRGFKLSKIARLTNRSSKTIWTTYQKANQKMPERFSQLTDDKSIPLALFSLRVLSVLESLVAYIKDTYDLTYHETAVLLNRDDRTVWTVYQRAKKKGGLP